MFKIAPPTAKHRALAVRELKRFETLASKKNAEAYDHYIVSSRDLVSALVADPHTSKLDDWLLMARWCVLTGDGFRGAHCHEAIARLAGERAREPAIKKAMKDLKRGYKFEEHLAKARHERPAFIELYDSTLEGKGDPYAIGCAYADGTAVLRCEGAESMWYQLAANQGHTSAMLSLSKQLFHGLGIDEDKVAAFKWALKAARLGHVAACAKVSIYYRDGDGCEQDRRKAAEWMERAAESEPEFWTDASSLYLKFDPAKAIECLERAIAELLRKGEDATYWMKELAEIYRDHERVHEMSKALHWFHRAAELGQTHAMAELGWIYEAGVHVQRDPVVAQQWLEKACLGHGWNGKDVADRFANGTDGTLRDDVLARHFYRLAGEGGDYSAWIELALFHYEGRGGEVDHDEAGKCLKRAIEKNAGNWSIALSIDTRETLANRHELAYPWYKRAAEEKNAYGLEWMGTYYLYGWGGRKDVKRAERYFEKWFKVRPTGMGHHGSHPVHEIGDHYATGNDRGEGADDARAVSWYRRGARAGESPSLVRLGLFMTAGRGVKRDQSKAQEMFRKAVDYSRGPGSEAFMIGCCFREGVIVAPNETLAKQWLKRAAKGGEDDAERLLADGNAKPQIAQCDYDMRMLWELWAKIPKR